MFLSDFPTSPMSENIYHCSECYMVFDSFEKAEKHEKDLGHKTTKIREENNDSLGNRERSQGTDNNPV